MKKCDELLEKSSSIEGYRKILPFILLQIPFEEWEDKIDKLLLPDVELKLKYFKKSPHMKTLVPIEMAGKRLVGIVDHEKHQIENSVSHVFWATSGIRTQDLLFTKQLL